MTVRALGLVRVSRERDGMVSPEMQRASIETYAGGRGYQVVDWLEGLDESGSRRRSGWWPRLEEAVGRVEAGEVDVILVWKFSRTARHRLRWATALDRVETAGGQLESATEQVDARTSTGRFTRGMLAELNAFEAERIGEVWKEVHSRRVSNGRPATGKPRYGYRYDPTQQLHVPDPITGPALVEAFRRYLAGESVYELVRWLNAAGWTTTSGGLWSDRTLRRVMDSGFAAGKFTANGQAYDGVHQALIGPEVWQAYLEARGQRRARPARVERSQYLLSGLVRCGRCGGRMVAGQYGASHQPKYRCAAAKEKGPAACAGGYVVAAYVERAVFGWLVEHRDLLEEPVQRLALPERSDTQVSEERLRRAVKAAEEALARLVVQNATIPLPKLVYVRAEQQLLERLRAAEEALAAAERGDGAPAPAAGFHTVDELLERWDAVPVPHRREVLRQVIGHVTVKTGRPSATVDVHRSIPVVTTPESRIGGWRPSDAQRRDLAESYGDLVLDASEDLTARSAANDRVRHRR